MPKKKYFTKEEVLAGRCRNNSKYSKTDKGKANSKRHYEKHKKEIEVNYWVMHMKRISKVIWKLVILSCSVLICYWAFKSDSSIELRLFAVSGWGLWCLSDFVDFLKVLLDK